MSWAAVNYGADLLRTSQMNGIVGPGTWDSVEAVKWNISVPNHLSPVCPWSSHRVGPVLRGMIWKRTVLWRLGLKDHSCYLWYISLQRPVARPTQNWGRGNDLYCLMWEMVWMHRREGIVGALFDSIFHRELEEIIFLMRPGILLST